MVKDSSPSPAGGTQQLAGSPSQATLVVAGTPEGRLAMSTEIPCRAGLVWSVGNVQSVQGHFSSITAKIQARPLIMMPNPAFILASALANPASNLVLSLDSSRYTLEDLE